MILLDQKQGVEAWGAWRARGASSTVLKLLWMERLPPINLHLIFTSQYVLFANICSTVQYVAVTASGEVQ